MSFVAPVAAGVEAAAKALQARGARLMDIPLPAPLSHYRRAAGIINPADSYSIHEADFLERTGLMGQAPVSYTPLTLPTICIV